MRIKRESSERSDSCNSLKKAILSNKNFEIISFEGSPSKNGKLTALFDKFAVDISFKGISPANLGDYLTNDFIKNCDFSREISLKKKISDSSSIRWIIVFHDSEERSVLIEYLNKDWEFKKAFVNATDFSDWLYNNYSETRVNISKFQENGLPEYDCKMRANGKPWPGNIDGILFYKEVPISIIEFQTTNKQTVQLHDNNDWWEPKNGRKGDKNRWISVKTNSESLGLPILVGVWSRKEDVFGIKKIQEFNLDEDAKKHIIWETKKYVKFNDVSNTILNVLGITKSAGI